MRVVIMVADLTLRETRYGSSYFGVGRSVDELVIHESQL